MVGRKAILSQQLDSYLLDYIVIKGAKSHKQITMPLTNFCLKNNNIITDTVPTKSLETELYKLFSSMLL